jgi:outer membrane protein assembly factor BamB
MADGQDAGGKTGRHIAAMVADQLLRSDGVRPGLCVHAGCGDGTLTAELARGGTFLVHGLSSDPGDVAKARRHVRARGLYGKVSVDLCSPAQLPYVDNLVNAVVVDDLPALLEKGFSVSEVMRVLCPGGVALLGRRDDAGGQAFTEAQLKAVLIEAGVADISFIKAHGLWAKVAKPWPDDPGPDAPPSRVQWMAGPIWSRGHFSTLNWQSAGGRVFYFFDEAPTQVEGPAQVYLTSRDAFNGLLLWKRRMPGDWKYPALQRAVGKFLATDERVYVVLEENGSLVALDAATGKTVRTYAGQSPTTIRRWRDALILAGGGPIRSMDPATGELRWQSEVAGTFDVGGDQVYCQARASLACLSASTGQVVWQRKPPWGRKKAALRCHYRGILLFAESKGHQAGAVHVVSAEDGKHLWSRDYNAPSKSYGRDPLTAGGLVWIHIREDKEAGVGWLGLDPMTGDIKRRIDYPPELVGKVRQRCFPNRIVGRFFVTGKDPVYVDWRTGQVRVVKVARGTCRAGGGFHSAYGLAYTGPHQCHCFPMLRGFVALAVGSAADHSSGDHEPTARLEKGPVFGRALGPAAGPATGEWPCYRHDALRSGRTTARVPTDLRVLWSRHVGGRISGPVVAGGRLFVSSMDTHQVMALDADTGDALWDFTSGGPIDTPPTVWRGLCLFGSRDGWAYCLEASSGKLVWRFRAAPRDRRIVVNGRLESAWPVFGSVVVQDGTVFFAAGRDARVGGGITVYAVEPLAGKVLWKKRPSGDYVSDILVSDGESVCLPALRFDPRTGDTSAVDKWKPAQLRGGRGGLLDDSLGIREGGWSGPVGKGRILIITGPNDLQIANRAGWSGPKADGQVQVFDSQRAYAIASKARNDAFLKQGQGEWTVSARHARKGPPAWEVTVPIRPRAMLLADQTLFLAGTPDIADPQDPWAAIKGGKGATLWALSKTDGAKLGETTLDVPPVWDGLAAAGGRLYISLTDGRLLCLGGQPGN